MADHPIWVRAGFTRRAAAFLIDLVIVMLLTQALVACIYGMSGGRVQDSSAFVKECVPAKQRPAGLSLPAGFIPTGEAVCTSYLMSKPVARYYVFEHKAPGSPLKQTIGFPLDTADQPTKAFDLTLAQWPLLALLRWALESRGWRSPGRSAAGLLVLSSRHTTRDLLNQKLTTRYLGFAAAGLPAVVFAAFAVFAAWSDFPALSAVMLWLTGIAGWLPSIALVAATISVCKQRDTFYDEAAGTRVVRLFDPQMDEAPAAEAPSIQEDRFPSLGTVVAGVRAGFALSAVLLVMFAAELVTAHSAGRVTGFMVDWQSGVQFGGVSSELVAQGGQWYRLATSSFLHWSLNHLASNLVALLLIAVLLEPVIGAAWFIAIFLLSGLGGAGLSIVQNPPIVMSMGASGGILGLMASGLMISFRLAPGWRRLWLQAVTIVILTGTLTQGSWLPALGPDHAAHLGGMLAGGATGFVSTVFFGSKRYPSIGKYVMGAALLASSLTAASLPMAGFGDFPLDRLLVPPKAMPRNDQEWASQASELARRYPRDPRPYIGLALAAGADVESRERALDRVKLVSAALKPNDQVFVMATYRNGLKAVVRARIAARDFTVAQAKLDEALALQLPLDPDLLYLRAEAEQHLGDWASAKADLQKLVSAKPTNAPGWISLAFVTSAMGDQTAAINLSGIALLHDPKSFIAYRQRGWFFVSVI
ncbi:rhomboid family intramembrane serine protease [Bosea sp. TND4EK4]|uniref:rhomboid family intramembrane serine protease n=1 Tax=Bosea sp. TND4EK4 TaxID=1907408 RepID=UPI0009567966|nr:rhomboid family intramembrane serine protease [Bosea sp. TND4EK4]SIR63102.1 Membrane associated serine protease, rhomboid family [Bosea sp. TND4EK4]